MATVIKPDNRMNTAEIPPEIQSAYYGTNSFVQYGLNSKGLTLYDVDREPRPPITDDGTTTLQVRNLNLELTCPICLGVLHNTMTVMECLHRFCAGCIETSLRLGYTRL